MPVRNVVRVQIPDTFYHVYNRGHNKSLLFADDADYDFFAFLLARCFGPKQLKDTDGKLFPWFGDRAQINAFCLMPNHFHLLLHQFDDEKAISAAMQSLATTYSIYFNKKYDRRGSAFESVFKSVPIQSDSYLMHISRYIHLNPKNYRQWQYSSYKDYRGQSVRPWLSIAPILDLFESTSDYNKFVDDYKQLRDELEDIKHGLADHGITYYAI